MVKAYQLIFHCLILFAALCVSAGASFAQQSINIRSGLHPDYTRIVFDWPEGAASYNVNNAGATSTIITFDQNVTRIDRSGLNLQKSKQVSAVDIVGIAPLSVSVSHSADASTRAFTVSNRVVLDVKVVGSVNEQAKKKAEASKQAIKKKAAQPKAKPKQKTSAVKAVNDVKAPAQAKLKAPKAAAKKENEAAASIKDSQEDKDSELSLLQKEALKQKKVAPNKIVFSTTTVTSLAAYIRDHRLWMVVDKPEYYVMPQIRGPHPEKFGSFNRIDVPEGTAFYMDLPKDIELYASGEGGGLTWNILLSQTRPKRKLRWPKREVDKNRLRGGKYLSWDLENVSRVIEFRDPFAGDMVHAALVENPEIYSGGRTEFVDLIALDSIVGLAVVPKIDDLEVRKAHDEVVISHPLGLALLPESDVKSYQIRAAALAGKQNRGAADASSGAKSNTISGRIFRFDTWRLGGPSMLRKNQQVMMTGLTELERKARAQDLVSLAKLEISNGRGAEAVGYLKYAGEELRDVRNSLEYLALLGASYAMNHQYDVAFRIFSVPQLDSYDEIKFWRAFVLANLGDWTQAGRVVPDNVDFIRGYPKEIRLPLAVDLAEVFLRKGDVEKAAKLLEYIEEQGSALTPEYAGALKYLSGELMRQKKNYKGAKEAWREVIKGDDDFYRTRARLALSDLRYQTKEITIDKAIDNLERLRFAWRGDDLEMTINYRLGQLYIEKKSYLKGLSVLRQAVTLGQGTIMGKNMTAYMRRQYEDLFLGEEAKKLTPLQAAMIYEEFSELTPAGDRGDELLQSLAGRLVDVDLLDRAAEILSDQVKHRTAGSEQIEVGLRLAGIQLLDNKNKEAIKTLDILDKPLNQMPILDTQPYRRQINLLRARAYSRDGRTNEALVLLNNMKQDDDVVRLKADAAWIAGYWNDAAEALEDLVGRMNITPSASINDKQADSILNWAVALSLSGNRHVMANIRKQYGEQMQSTAKGRLFEVVTRPRKNAVLADRETIAQIVSEVDIFSDFLESYRAPEKSE